MERLVQFEDLVKIAVNVEKAERVFLINLAYLGLFRTTSKEGSQSY
jgi:hypothetical protein